MYDSNPVEQARGFGISDDPEMITRAMKDALRDIAQDEDVATEVDDDTDDES